VEMRRVARENRIKNEYVRDKIVVASIVDKIRENILRCFWYVMRREETKSVRVVMKMNVEGRSERPINKWLDTFK